ncbi:hypothetical protein [Campylobacter gastrosuis]|uniref:Uncharacterized protein n=1 Tax=Campylobacter gastrosuis TaxID=2974576 RepID=A0ABT7HTI0_9BACT|nr:hypothetical protein [Campylobacter gastrosuis]MDL0089738.1 hypothetical protein [Campylobacter gastrosuis]
MNDFFESLKEIKKEMTKVQKAPEKKPISKDEAIALKEKKLRDEFLAYIKNSDIKKLD